MQDGFEEILTKASPAVQELAKRTRALIKEIMPDVVEVPGQNKNTLATV